MNFDKVIQHIIIEADNVLKTTSNKPIVDAIKNRRKITFDYYGPRKPKKDSVKPGKRIKVEPVAMGLSKKGNLIIRAWVEPPSVTKTGFGKGNWRTFMLSRTKNIQISDETFDSKRPQYKEGDDNSMSVTYVTSDWTKTPKVKKEKKPQQLTPEPKPTEPTPTKPSVEPVSTEKPQPEPQKQELPQPKPNVKPEPTQKEPESTEPEKEELPQPKPEEKPSQTPEDDENKNLQESIRKIKHLMFS